ncbi:Lactate utilization protein A [Planctomycetes bacterium Pla163]|uniref:Glycolate oxidase iron-sulfur subunit n=1 Tax=Rohdeia mirabilis TaxID=2528008 RepID=A0A518CWQ2_9BACT|nr:Lactate utilization protein A [Planctomycetes bacterium Pla163]
MSGHPNHTAADAPRTGGSTRGFDLASLVEYTKTLECIHCGLCLTSCPTYQLTGVESSSPRGRIHLMRSVAEGDLEPDAEYADEMDFCLLCRHCETACPAGVEFGALMEHARSGLTEQMPRPPLARALRWIGFRFVLPRRRVLDLAGAALRAVQITGVERIGRWLLARAGSVVPTSPRVPKGRARRRLEPSTPADGAARGAVDVLEGCVMPVLFGRVNRATGRSLAGLGYESRPLAGVTCCGSLHAHNGDLDGARTLARRMLAAARATERDGSDPLPLVVNSAGCSAHLKELHHLFDPDDPDRAAAEELAARVYDFTEFAAPRLRRRPPERSIEGAWKGPFAYDDPCHLCHAQQIRTPPRDVLAALPGLELVPLENSEGCCGSAGIYSVLRPADSAAVLEPKLDALERSGARTLVTANPGCHLQWQAGIERRGLDVRVVHVAELVARAYDGRTTE